MQLQTPDLVPFENLELKREFGGWTPEDAKTLKSKNNWNSAQLVWDTIWTKITLKKFQH